VTAFIIECLRRQNVYAKGVNMNPSVGRQVRWSAVGFAHKKFQIEMPCGRHYTSNLFFCFKRVIYNGQLSLHYTVMWPWTLCEGVDGVIINHIQYQSTSCIYYIILYYIILYYITLHYITLHYITLHYIILYYIILYYTILYYIVLYNIICIQLHAFVCFS